MGPLIKISGSFPHRNKKRFKLVYFNSIIIQMNVHSKKDINIKSPKMTTGHELDVEVIN